MVKLDKWDIRAILLLLHTGNFTHKEIADKFKVTRGHVTKIANKRRWSKVNEFQRDIEIINELTDILLWLKRR
jgi:predicted XRE-type DNA-binding protein